MFSAFSVTNKMLWRLAFAASESDEVSPVKACKNDARTLKIGGSEVPRLAGTARGPSRLHSWQGL